MTQVHTNLRITRESARQIRVEPTTAIGGTITETNIQKALEELDDDIQAIVIPSVQIVTASGTTTVLPGTTDLIFRKSVASNSPFNLPPGVNGAKIKVSDETGLAGDMTANPSGTDNVMGVNTPTVVASSGGIPQSGGVAVLEYYSVILGWVVSR